MIKFRIFGNVVPVEGGFTWWCRFSIEGCTHDLEVNSHKMGGPPLATEPEARKALEECGRYIKKALMEKISPKDIMAVFNQGTKIRI